jgi:serralysin
MATITLGTEWGDFPDWLGRLFEADDGPVVLAQTATTYTFRHGANHGLADYTVSFSGTGFAYNAGEVTGGRITGITVRDPNGTVIATFGNFPVTSLAADFAQIWSDMFGYETPDGDRGPDGKTAWSHVMSGNDVINGTAGDDDARLPGFDVGKDTYNLFGGDDRASGGVGNDKYFGGDGYDFLDYSETNWNEGAAAYRGLQLNAQTGIALDPWGGRDTISGFEQYRGSRFNDSFIGKDAEQDDFAGGRGRDTFDGGANALDAGGSQIDNRDRVRYEDDYWQGGERGIVVKLETSFANNSIRGTIRDGFGQLDTVIDIERVDGTRFDDVFEGSRVNNRFRGGEGKDSFDGKDGFDTIDFDRDFADTTVGAVSVDLAKAGNQIIDDGFGNTETAVGIEGLATGSGNDTLKGSAAGEFFEGRYGSDLMTGRGGSDYFFWFESAQIGFDDRITDFDQTGADRDLLAFEVENFDGMTGTAVVVNGGQATQAGVGTFAFTAATQTLFWDHDGAGGDAKVKVAVLTGVTALSAGDFDLFT